MNDLLQLFYEFPIKCAKLLRVSVEFSTLACGATFVNPSCSLSPFNLFVGADDFCCFILSLVKAFCGSIECSFFDVP